MSAADARAWVLAEADRITRRSRWELAWARWHGRAEYDRGWRDGYEQAAADLERDWQEFARPVAQRLASGLGLMDRRWPGGREHFGDPRSGDYQGREGAA